MRLLIGHRRLEPLAHLRRRLLFLVKPRRELVQLRLLAHLTLREARKLGAPDVGSLHIRLLTRLVGREQRVLALLGFVGGEPRLDLIVVHRSERLRVKGCEALAIGVVTRALAFRQRRIFAALTVVLEGAVHCRRPGPTATVRLGVARRALRAARAIALDALAQFLAPIRHE